MEKHEVEEIQKVLVTIVEELGGVPDAGRVAFWEALAERLSNVVRKAPAWNWRYPKQILDGTTQPSELFARAVYALGAAMDDVPVMAADTVAVTILARPGAIRPGSLVLGESRPCLWPGCKVWFVPRAGNQKFCDRRMHEKQERATRGRETRR